MFEMDNLAMVCINVHSSLGINMLIFEFYTCKKYMLFYICTNLFKTYAKIEKKKLYQMKKILKTKSGELFQIKIARLRAW
ncbi:hypothetical protein PUN28_008336 [Cardiocondyla obscurior]|uniref:Uncharacterized protein n=1 Tax=Cardiocondyla obscurior TaxID=286306 RepID=A0AAW2G233_9HYME